MSKYGDFSGPYIPAFEPEKNFVFGHFSHTDLLMDFEAFY